MPQPYTDVSIPPNTRVSRRCWGWGALPGWLRGCLDAGPAPGRQLQYVLTLRRAPPASPQVMITGCSLPANGAPFRSIVIPQSSEVRACWGLLGFY